ncbi:GSCOCG00003905001-RA-CDS [Cotesia congregata]|nr:GSCOCG00003905001-RA-CDS [Cotesia congregata]
MDKSEYYDLITERRKSSDIMWASRYMDIVVPHYLSPEHNWTRNQAIEFTLKHPKVLNTIESLAESQGVDRAVIVREAKNILEEVASRHNLPTFRWLAIIVVKVLKRILQSFRANVKYVLDIKSQMMYSDVQYVYVPSHRSYLDFILMSYLLFNYDMAIPNIASGMDFYRMNIVGEILRKTGAFYMRRSFSSDVLYKETFKAYVASLVEHSDRAIEFFIEGTRSRSQKSIAPKFGLLGMILESLFQGKIPDILFVPVSISYDKPLEESLFSYELLGVPKPAETTTGLFKSLSILREHQAHGHVYFHVSPPISAAKFMDVSSRKLSALNPNSRVPAEVVKNIAYAIIDSHKEHTVFMPINLIAVLVNERIHSHPGNPYTFDTLLQDYCWLKKLITHNGLLIIHGSHREIKSNKTIRVKGHTLDDRTMSIAVPTINLAIYVNPIFAIFTKLSIAVLSINSNNLSQEIAEEQYLLLRSLLTTEFALPDNMNRGMIIDEFRKELSFLINEKCYRIDNNQLSYDCNNYLRMMLYNLVLPFISAVYVTCVVLLQWDKSMDELSDQEIMKECQKRTEVLLFQAESFINHPYTLSLDLYTSTVVSLTSFGALTPVEGKPRVYNPDKPKLSSIISDLEKIMSQRSPGNYVDLAQTYFHLENTLQAKL